MRRGGSQQFERQCVEAVTGKDRGRLVIGLVDGRLAAADIVVVHRWKVVVD